MAQDRNIKSSGRRLPRCEFRSTVWRKSARCRDRVYICVEWRQKVPLSWIVAGREKKGLHYLTFGQWMTGRSHTTYILAVDGPELCLITLMSPNRLIHRWIIVLENCSMKDISRPRDFWLNSVSEWLAEIIRTFWQWIILNWMTNSTREFSPMKYISAGSVPETSDWIWFPSNVRSVEWLAEVIHTFWHGNAKGSVRR